MPQLRLSGIRKNFSARGRAERVLPVLDGIDLIVNDREFVAIIGPSGCGKSTLFEITCGLQQPDVGRVELDGEDVTGQTGFIGYMPQSDLLFPWRRLLDNVTLGREVQGGGRERAREDARRLLPLFGLEGFEYSYPHELSGGMRQRAALLRTFLCGRKVIALDEPFGALDALTRREMQQWLDEVRVRFESTIVLITHDIDEALMLADRVCVLSSRPAVVKGMVDVDLPHPRDLLSRDAVRLKAEVLHLLEAGNHGR